jgi:type III secretion protein C
MRTRFNSAISCLIILIAVLAGRPAFSAPAPWPDASFTYIADKQDLSVVLESFCRTFGLELQSSPAVLARKDIVNGKLTTSNPTEFLNQLSSTYGLQWFYYGGTLYISRNFETATRSISPGVTLLDNFHKALIDLGVVEQKFGWGELPDRGVAIISGPPAYVDLVVWAVSTLPLPQPDQQIKVFRLKHAQVDDRVISYRDQQITTSGVATILRSLINGDSSRPAGGNPQSASSTVPMQTMPATGERQDVNSADSGNRKDAGGTQEGTKTSGNSEDNRRRPVIQADSRLNAVIIKDVPQRMSIYEDLIKSLDVPSKLIEIEAVIVDVNSTRIAELGIDWGARSGNLAGGFGIPTIAPDAVTGTIVLGKNVNPTTVIADAGNYLMARIRVMESNGDASVVSRPSILTLDNLGALIDLSETFYVQSIGERVANVVPVSVGVTLKVTPHIVEIDNQQSVHLVVDIEDGALQDRLIQNLPTIRRSTIGTQAVMREHESLLIGGFNSEQDIHQADQVPGLGNLPIIGIFFKKKTTNRSKSERLFLITPKIISSTPPQVRN